jgi:tetratricopeptide (TPR) repeat protein
MKRVLIVGCLAVSLAWGGSDIERAQALYNHTEYNAALDLLKRSPEAKTVAGYEIAGKAAYQLGDFKRAIDAFEKAVQMQPGSARLENWLGRAWGRRAETSNPLMAPSYASRSRQHFERAVELDPKNEDAVDDLFSYYLEAPGFLGGGTDKAQALAERIKQNDPAEYHGALAQLAERRKQYDFAEAQLRRAVELAPRQAGRLVDLAKFLARRGKLNEAEKTFQLAAKTDPGNRGVLFARAETYIAGGRNLAEARRILEEYVRSPLTPDDPSREEARRLLKRVSN